MAHGQHWRWYRELSGYHWYVLLIASLGWLFDTLDQQLFVLARSPALATLLGTTTKDPAVTRYGGYATSAFIVGWATGGLVFGLLGDRLGRVRTMMITILIYSAFTGLSAFSVGWIDFSVYRFLTGLGVGGEFAAGVSLVAEVMPDRARPFALALLQALSAVGNMGAAGISFFIRPGMPLGTLAGQPIAGWRWLFLAGIFPALLVAVILRTLKEPDRWVRAKQAAAGGGNAGEAHGQLGNLRELFGDARLRYHAVIGVLLAATGVMGLWGVGFWTPELVRGEVLRNYSHADQDWYVSMSMLVQNLGALPGIYAFSLVTAALGRRRAFAVAYALALASTVAVFGFMTGPSQIWWMLPMLGFSTLMIFGGFAVYFPELFPTRLRSTGTGFCYNVARYLAAAAPYLLGKLSNALLAPQGTARAAGGLSSLTWLSSLGSTDSALRYAALAVSAVYILGLLLLPWAPETRDQPLPE